MGVFDYLKCTYPLPGDPPKDAQYQTKDTDAQYLDNYEIRQDGGLWHEAYESKFTDNGKEGMAALVGCMSRENVRWERKIFTGEICFYGDAGCYSAYFVDGVLNQVHEVRA
jgi:hypothetical protein